MRTGDSHEIAHYSETTTKVICIVSYFFKQKRTMHCEMMKNTMKTAEAKSQQLKGKYL